MGVAGDTVAGVRGSDYPFSPLLQRQGMAENRRKPKMNIWGEGGEGGESLRYLNWRIIPPQIRTLPRFPPFRELSFSVRK